MWKRTKNTGQSTTRPCFSIVHQYILHFNEVSGNKSAAIRRRSKTPGVMITQYTIRLPEGKSTPDFQCKPAPVTTQEGKLAVFKAVVTGNPKPDVSWRRTRGNLSDKDKFKQNYNESTGEYILEIHKVTAAETDTYKCYAVNEFGKAVCSTTLGVLDGSTNPEDFRKMLRKSKVEKANGDNNEKFWDAMLNADRRDYERICSEYEVTDLQLILKKLEEKRTARAQNRNKDGVIPCDVDAEEHGVRSAGRTNGNRINRLLQNDSGLHLGDVEEVNLRNRELNQAAAEEDLLPTEFKLSNVDFVIKIQEIKAEERDDALFECVLTHPLPKITWMKKGIALEDGEKYSITVSTDRLIHKLLIKDCSKTDKGIYSAIAGITSCSAWLVVEAKKNPASGGTKAVRKTALAGGAQTDLEKVAKEQQMKNQQEMEKILKAVKAKHAAGKTKEEVSSHSGGDLRESERKEKAQSKNSEDGAATNLDDLECVMEEGKRLKASGLKNKRRTKVGVGFSKATGCVCPEFGDECSDVDQHQTLNTSEHDMPESKRNTKNLVKSVKKKTKPKKVHWKDHTSDPNESASDSEPSDSDENEESTDQKKQQRSSKQSNKSKEELRDPNESASDSEPSDSDKNEESTDQKKQQRSSKWSKKSKKAADGENTFHDDHSECEEAGDVNNSSTRTRRKRLTPLVKDFVIDPGVQFVCGLSDVDAIISEMAELTCKLSSEDCEGAWFRDGKKIFPDDNFLITKDGPIHKLVIVKCIEEYSGKYRFEADGRKTEAMVNVKDPPRFDSEGLCAFTEPLTVKVGHHAIFKLQFVGYKPIKIQWYRDGEELQEDNNTKIEKSSSHSRLLLSRCQRKDTGEIKIKLKNDHGFTEAVSQLIVLDKPTPPLGPAEVMESSASCIEFKWRPPKDDGGSPVTNYILERQQVGRNTWKKIGELPAVPKHRDTDVDRGRKYCYRIRAVTSEGTSEVMETDEMQAGKFAFPGPPAPPKVVSAFNDCINLSWVSPANSGGSRILGYILEKRKKGSNLWTVVNASDEIIKEKKYAVKDVVEGIEYEFRVSAINLSGAGEFSNPSEFVFARDPKKPPGKVTSLKVTETSYTNMVVTWTKPEDKPGEQDEAKGYFVEIRQADCTEWSRCNSTPIIMTSFNVKSLKSMDMYWVRVIAMNDGGESATEELPRYVLAMPLPVRPKFTNKKMKSFMVVRAGNSVRITVNFEASPRPEVTWLKDNVPLTKRVTISNSDGSSQLLIPTSERSDSGIYSILVKNFAGQETFSTEVRVTDDPKPPGPVELEESVPGTVTVIWKPSPDEKRDDRLHYTVSKLDSTKHTWITVADRLFNNKFTVCNIMQGREYHFRVYAKNDMGISAPSESPTWGMEKKKDKFVISEPTNKDCDLRCAPAFIVPLKLQTATAGYECLMSCAVKGNPTPRITWYRNHVSLNTDTNFYISNVFGVCSLKILRVGPKDMAEYTVIAENSQGRAECSTVLNIRE
ncbi:immunoglobulin-like and fibronectin type III domain-containing protein 1 isoform X2 [Kryptolebias marmoratus]|uniref:immunoglobulin-like and fibronectin type III domain-containing protein 1 isoform X2 n=1 Tax=Kryptolebias marmoratus TaxID=37003 RepID=UPI000D52F1BC|nr:immunoglobulin-like and fibronectin type III domain-containing protein 1 isoform X2 [Kryptolebias marmoratus]